MQINHNDQIAGKAISLYVIFIPLLWMLGALIPLGAFLMLYLFTKILSKDVIADKILLTWWLVALMQGVSVVINWAEADQTLNYLLYRLMSSTVSGWIFLGVILSVGKNYHLLSRQLARAASIMGLYFLLFGLIAIVMGLLLKRESLEAITPIGQLLPSDLPAVQNLFTMRFFKMDPFLNFVFPRLILFYPWSVCLGFAGIGIFFMSLNEERPFWKALGITGGLFATISSLSRAAIIAFFLSCLFYLWLRLNRTCRWLHLPVLSIVISLLLLSNISIENSAKSLYRHMSELRPGSSEARETGYEESWRGFLKSPCWGNGWPGEEISKDIPMPIGSHSSFYGLLYTGGIMTFGAFCIALLFTITPLLLRAIRGSAFQRSAFVIALTLAIASYGEGIYSFVLPNLLIFCWLGRALSNKMEYA